MHLPDHPRNGNRAQVHGCKLPARLPVLRTRDRRRTAGDGFTRSCARRWLAVPERMQKHLYRACHNNKEGIVQRDSVSCRKTHRNSPMGHFAPGFDSKGNPVARRGFMVPCNRHSDCASTCP
eukprot:1615121-Prymnesium_polylepis.1